MTEAGPEGHFHPPELEAEPQGVLTVGFGAASNVAELTARFDGLRPTTARAAQVSAGDGAAESATADTVSLTDLGGTSVLGAENPRVSVVTGSGVAGAGELQAYVQAVVDRSAWALRADGDLNTTRYEGVLRAKKPVSLRGIGPSLSGVYYVEKVLHAFTAEGYTQRFTLRRNAFGLSGAEDFTGTGAGS
ncbi:MAG: hypothetical protein GWN71_34115 [Gammaproteobacteria bacterium]|nr:hypothetical protein [Gammaproteobacteria bacterium]